MTAQDIRISRDHENDVLYVLKNSATPETITNIIVSENITVRLNAEIHEIVGFTIDEFSLVCPEWKDQKEYELMEYFDEVLDVLNDPCKLKLTTIASSSVGD